MLGQTYIRNEFLRLFFYSSSFLQLLSPEVNNPGCFKSHESLLSLIVLLQKLLRWGVQTDCWRRALLGRSRHLHLDFVQESWWSFDFWHASRCCRVHWGNDLILGLCCLYELFGRVGCGEDAGRSLDIALEFDHANAPPDQSRFLIFVLSRHREALAVV